MARELLKVSRGRAICAVMIVIALLGTEHGWTQNPQSAIPDELAVIAAACRENSARIESLQLSGTLTATGGWLEGQWDPIADQTYNSQTREFSVWKDALNCRFDVTADREVDGQTGEVIYHLPYAEHITSYAKLDREGGFHALKREYGTPQHTTRTIVTPDQGYQYEPESNELRLNIDPFTVRALNEQLGMQFALNRTLHGFTMAESVDRWAELATRGDRSIEVTPLGDGQYRIRSTVTAPHEGNPTHCSILDVVVDLDQGGNVLSQLYQTDGQIVETGQFEYMNVNGAWVVAHAEVARQIGPDGVPLVNAVYDVRPESIRINEPIDPVVFSFEGLGVRRGAHVQDHKTGEEYLYDDIPLHLKVALAAAREKDKELAEAAAPAPQGPAPAEADRSAQELQEGQPGAAAGAAPVAQARATSGPSDFVVVTPTPAAEPPPDTMPVHELDQADRREARPPATRPADTHVLTPRAPTQPAERREPAEPPAPPAGPWLPSTAVTVVAVSAGVAAALAIGIWKVTRRT
jgi:hypothetical protein